MTNDVILKGIEHFKAKAERYRKLAEKAEAEVARLKLLAQQQATWKAAMKQRKHESHKEIQES